MSLDDGRRAELAAQTMRCRAMAALRRLRLALYVCAAIGGVNLGAIAVVFYLGQAWAGLTVPAITWILVDVAAAALLSAVRQLADLIEQQVPPPDYGLHLFEPRR
jgi:hypothetical protein